MNGLGIEDSRSSGCTSCSRSAQRAEHRGRHEEAFAILDAMVISSRQMLQAVFTGCGLLVRLEVAPTIPAAISYRDIAVQLGRPEPQAWRDAQNLDELCWFEILERGIGDHTRGPNDDYRKAVWDIGNGLWECDTARRRTEERRALRRAEERTTPGRAEASEQLAALLLERSADWDRDDDGEVYGGFVGGSVDDDVADWLDQVEVLLPADRRDADSAPWLAGEWGDGRYRCHAPSAGEIGRYLYELPASYVQVTEQPKVHDTSACACAPAAPSPAYYLGWADAFREGEAGIAGWWLACHQIRWTATALSGEDHLGPLRPAHAARLLGMKPSSARELLLRLVARGYAEVNPDGTYRLRFLDLYQAGELEDADNADALTARHQDDLIERSLRNPIRIVPPPPGTPGLFGVVELAPWLRDEARALVEETTANREALLDELQGPRAAVLVNFE